MPKRDMPSSSLETAGARGATGVSKHYSLHLSISALITLLLVVASSAIAWYNYSQNKSATLQTTEALFDRIADQMASSLSHTYAPVKSLVDLTVELEQVKSGEPEHSEELFDFFITALQAHPQLNAVFIGYAGGEQYLVRALQGDPAAIKAVSAPPGTEYVVQQLSISAESGKDIRYLYYDARRQPLGSGRPSNFDYDPRKRPWYKAAMANEGLQHTSPYVFYTTAELGVTTSRVVANRQAVVGADIRLHDLSLVLSQHRITPSTEAVVFDSGGTVMAYHDVEQVVRLVKQGDTGKLQTAHLGALQHPVMQALYQARQEGLGEGRIDLELAEDQWLGSVSILPSRGKRQIYLAILAPHRELLAPLERTRRESLLISLAMLLVAAGLGWLLSRRISEPLHRLAGEADEVRKMRFETPIDVVSRIAEIELLARTMGVMKGSVQHFVEIGKALSAEKDLDRLLQMILEEARQVCRADGGTVCLLNEDGRQLDFALLRNNRTGAAFSDVERETPSIAPEMLSEDPAITGETLLARVARTGNSLAVDDLDHYHDVDRDSVRSRYEQGEYRCVSLLAVPLFNRQGETIGVLELVNARDPANEHTVGFSSEMMSYAEALASSAAIALENHRLLKAQKDLLDSFIQVMAGAIDAKSHYTSGHCQRVPELAQDLAQAACDTQLPPFATFTLDSDDRETLHLASWLHDCGKVTTPEHVVDKATKLETIYNRIHEIRMRFEVLWRDAEIEYYRSLAEASGDPAAGLERLRVRQARLREDFAFVAECNRGSEFMAPEKLERLQVIASQRWMRQLDDQLGLSDEEQSRRGDAPMPVLPVAEPLLADKPEHRIVRSAGEMPFGDNPHGFRMAVPEAIANLGELHNLSVARGTLNDEERFRIDEHITQTIIMLNRLPFPRELRQVPRWAGSHHEKLNGSGYPRRLEAADLSIPERIMAIADIFEALTASDRPYKQAKTIAEALQIMSLMRDDGHICPELFTLFVSSGIPQQYAKQHLRPEQLDVVDVESVLRSKR
ncbi:MAG: HD domain-containing phosphohydrolase [Candidatus Sedimenticola sp. (ex Thyasira tokunagai)]